MTLFLHAAAAAVFGLACVVYYNGRFLGAGLLGLAYAALMSAVVVRSMNGVGAAFALGLLCVFPALFLAVHIVDARRGIFLMPTFYSIPLAFLCGAALWLIAGLGMVF